MDRGFKHSSEKLKIASTNKHALRHGQGDGIYWLLLLPPVIRSTPNQEALLEAVGVHTCKNNGADHVKIQIKNCEKTLKKRENTTRLPGRRWLPEDWTLDERAVSPSPSLYRVYVALPPCYHRAATTTVSLSRTLVSAASPVRATGISPNTTGGRLRFWARVRQKGRVKVGSHDLGGA